MEKGNNFIDFILEIKWRYREHNITAYAAQLAYFITLSIFPFLIFLFSLLGRFSLDSEYIIKIFLLIMPPESALIISNYLNDMVKIENFIIMPIFALATLWAASKGVNALMRALNIAYGVRENRGFFRLKILGIIYTLMFMISVVITTIITVMGKKFLGLINKIFLISEEFLFLFSYLRWILLIGFTIFLILSIYKVLPNRRLNIKNSIYGSVFSILGWVIMSVLFSYFVNNFSNYSIIYGSLAAVIILMIWLYLTATIIIIGGEINAILLDGFISNKNMTIKTTKN